MLFEKPTANFAQEWRFSYIKFALFSGIFTDNVNRKIGKISLTANG